MMMMWNCDAHPVNQGNMYLLRISKYRSNAQNSQNESEKPWYVFMKADNMHPRNMESAQ